MTELSIPAGGVHLAADLSMPAHALGVILFVERGPGTRFSPRNHLIASRLHDAGFGTLLVDLLTCEEEAIERASRLQRFDVTKLTARTIAVTEWLQRVARTQGSGIGYFATGTGAAAALIAAGHRPDCVSAVVCLRGCADLAIEVLPKIHAATLLIVGEDDARLLQRNELACRYLRCEKRLDVVPGMTHLLQEQTSLDRVADLAATWFVEHVPSPVAA